ncbi:MAG: 4-vinyl reductase [Chloroflexota bacterium]
MSEEQMKPPEAAGQQPEKPEEQAPAPAAGEAARPAAPAARPEGQAPAPVSGQPARPEMPPAAKPAAPSAAPAAEEPAKPEVPPAAPAAQPAAQPAQPAAQPAKPPEPAVAKPPAPAAPAAAAPAPAPAEAAKKAEEKPVVVRDKAAVTEEGSKLFYPNKWARIVLTSAEEVMGTQGVNALLNMAHMKELIGNYPPDNMKKQFDFNQMGQLQQGIWDMYGNRGARVFAVRAGEQSFKDGLTQFKAVAQAADVAMRFNSVSDQKVVVSEDDKHWIWTITTCPVCWGRETEEPCCHLAVGVLQAAFAWVSDGKKFRILETECKAKGDENCVIMIEKIPVE